MCYNKAMNVAVRQPMTLAEFLAWEERQPLRHEFDGVAPIAMNAMYGWSIMNVSM